ncbi:testis-expressed protein 9-like isoform X2 [Amphibalanus amphitrite]|uniref:testis-expressed protein 9-like isoform X2 n=1 Tax=Amphibalanus amphitrite TaxID=1232801 RepID=UPI001C91BECA|nr:testis-expressed protein 9-like isoform X2 [Amphibalanus amphitrite]
MDESDDAALRDKEEYYRKLNESLKSKAASLIAQAEKALKDQTDVSDSLELPAVKHVRQGTAKMTADDEPDPVLPCKLGEPYQVTLQPKTDALVPDHGSDTDDSLVEAFDCLEANDEPNSKSASSIASKNLSSAAQARLYQAKLRVTKAELTRLKVQYDKLLKQNNVLSDKLKVSEREGQSVISGSQKQAAEISRLKKALDDANNEVQKFRSECVSWKRDAENNVKEAQAACKSNSQTEIKLKRANEDVEKLKLALEAEKRRARDSAEAMKEKVASLESSNKQLDKQRQELIAGFKKQMKLIDVLNDRSFTWKVRNCCRSQKRSFSKW